MRVSSESAQPAWGRLRRHLDVPLYRTGYYLILGTGVTGILGVAFWALAAHSYSATVVGVNAAAISAVSLVSGACSLGLSAVLVRYLPMAGGEARSMVVASYAVTVALSVAVGVAAALTSSLWSSSLDFLAEPGWVLGFAAAAAATTVFTLQDSVLTGLRAAQWIPLENSLYSLAKLVLLIALISPLPRSGPFVAWNAPLLAGIVLVNYLIFRRLIPAGLTRGSLDRTNLFSMAAGNYAGKLFSLATNLYLPILVANLANPAEAAYFYIPWMISLSFELVALNVMTSLTVEAAVDLPQMRELARSALRHSLTLVVPLTALIVIVAPWGLRIFGSEYADQGTPLLRLLALGMIPNAIVALGISVARIQHRGLIVAAVQGVLCVLVLGLTPLLLPGRGIEAIGVIWAGSQAILALFLLGGILRPLLLRLS